MNRYRHTVLLLTFAVTLPAPSLLGIDFPTREEILREVYPGADARAERLFLTKIETEAIQALGGAELPSPLIARYVLTRNGTVVGHAYVDTHVVRTKKQSLLICLDSDGSVRRIEVTAFLEPPEYGLPDAWYRQYEGKGLSEDLRLQRAIRSVAGATLTSIASSQAARRAMAIDKTVGAKPGGTGR